MTTFCYEKAFCRNIGILSREEQDKLRSCKVALAGVGGVGSFYAHAMARLGVGRFSIADGGSYEVANFNRQMGGNMDTIGVNKARAVTEQVLKINPTAQIDVFEENLGPTNTERFLEDADIFLNGVEIFNVEDHRYLFTTARKMGIHSMMAAPFGFSGVIVGFSPDGMSAEDYFDWGDGQNYEEQMCCFALGLAPSFLRLKELNLKFVDIDEHIGPSHVAACLICSGLMAMEVTRIILDRKGAWCAPEYRRCNPDKFKMESGVLRNGNKGLVQRMRRKMLLRKWKALHHKEAPHYGTTPVCCSRDHG